MIKAKAYERRERILKLLREAIEAENMRDTETAKKRLSEVLELSEVYEPEFYFEACFRMANVLLEEEDYRGAVEYSLRGIRRAPSREHYRLGIVRLGEVLRAIKAIGKLGELAKEADERIEQIKDDEELYGFVLEVLKIARGQKSDRKFRTKEFNAVLESLSR
ncbi:MAG: hypothetical protein GXO14_05490 [Thermococci archaeon]|nr:hypothetical protein [Thermococci archaeon]